MDKSKKTAFTDCNAPSLEPFRLQKQSYMDMRCFSAAFVRCFLYFACIKELVLVYVRDTFFILIKQDSTLLK
jgi:hypothetical protein